MTYPIIETQQSWQDMPGNHVVANEFALEEEAEYFRGVGSSWNFGVQNQLEKSRDDRVIED